ncbi:hypothetical protein F5Y06DRAFT_302066 [Hypoxylon sp. FL0890]|nr:hypothetical protein F5Y06DRAFT_302066 [Hypoxylon sp. FL0890]
MNRSQISLLQREIYGDQQERAFRLPCRSQSLPPLRSQSWASEDASFRPPQRSQSLKAKVKRLPLIIPQYVTALGEVQLGIGLDEDYDSDEEDRRNGVPITVSENRGRELTLEMMEDVFQRIEEKLEKKRELHKQLTIPKQGYLTTREWLFESRGVGWDAWIWLHFNILEDEYYERIDEIHKLECEIGHLETMLANFTDAQELDQNGWNVRGAGHRTWRSLNTDDKSDFDLLALELESRNYENIWQ